MLWCILTTSRLFQFSEAQHEKELDFQKLCQVRLEQQVSQHDDAIKAAGRIMSVLGHRSEEHTSELQSLMRLSYAVFCLKKKTNTNSTTQVLSKISEERM